MLMKVYVMRMSRLALVSSALVSPLMAAPSFSQALLPEVVTTATRTERSVFDALSSVDVIGARDLADRNPRSLGDALGALPNVSGQVGSRKSVEQLNIRGLDDRRAVIKIDGQRRNFRGEYKGRTFLSPSMIKRVEVVRGSTSVLDGSGALAGAINVETKDAADFLQPGQTYGVATDMYGATNGGQLGANVAVYGRTEMLDLIAFQDQSSAGNIDLGRDNELPQSELNTRQTLLKGTVTPNDDTTVALTLSDYYDRGDSTSNPVRLAPFAGLLTDRRAHQQDARVKANYAPAANKLVDVTTLLNAGKTNLTEVVTQKTSASRGRRDKTTYTNMGAEVFNTARFDAWGLNHALTAGVDIGQDTQEGTRPGTNRKELFPNAKSENYAVYAQNEMRVGKWDIVPGARFESYSLKGDTLNRTNKDSKATAKLAASYKLRDTWNVYGNIGQGFRAPLLTEAFSGGTLGGPLTLVPNPNLKPEESTNYEAGSAYAMTPGLQDKDNLTLRGSVFYTELANLIERQSINATQFAFRNVPDAHIKGVELSADYAVPEGWFGRASVGYTRGENDTQSRPLLDVPPLKANTTLGRQGQRNGSTWRAGWTMEAAASQTKVPPNDLLVGPSKGYVVHGLFGELRPKQRVFRDMTIGVNVDNMFDKQYKRVTSFIDETGVDVRARLSIKF